MFWPIVGAVLGAVLLVAGFSDLRRKRRTGRAATVDDARVTASVYAARAKAARYRRRGR